MNLLTVILQATNEEVMFVLDYSKEIIWNSVVNPSITFSALHCKSFTSVGMPLSKDTNIESIQN